MSMYICAYCGKDRGQHRAVSLHCPTGNGPWSWHPDNSFKEVGYEQPCTTCGKRYGDHNGITVSCPITPTGYHPTDTFTIRRSAVVVLSSAGMSCAVRSCGEFNAYGVPNQADGKTYICYSCRQSGRKA